MIAPSIVAHHPLSKSLSHQVRKTLYLFLNNVALLPSHGCFIYGVMNHENSLIILLVRKIARNRGILLIAISSYFCSYWQPLTVNKKLGFTGTRVKDIAQTITNEVECHHDTSNRHTRKEPHPPLVKEINADRHHPPPFRRGRFRT